MSTTRDIKRFDATGKLLKTIKGGLSNPIGIAVDLDCNLWVTNIAQRRLDRFSPSGQAPRNRVVPGSDRSGRRDRPEG